MKRERLLHLVPSSSPPPAGADEPPFSAEELRDAEALRDAIDRGADPLSSALRAAHAPGDLDAGDLDAILARALGEGDAPPTRAEQALADSLRDALDGRGALREEHLSAADLRAAHRPGEIDPERNEALIRRAIAAPSATTSAKVLPFRRRAIAITASALPLVAALAAGVALMIQRAEPPREAASVAAPAPPSAGLAAAARASLIRSRSTDDLFDPAEKFPVSGEESARIDRIALARASDLRQNRFAAWGVR
ncbi:MAG: hypothetical protein U0359_03055 [Byssovorax sp.]